MKKMGNFILRELKKIHLRYFLSEIILRMTDRKKQLLFTQKIPEYFVSTIRIVNTDIKKLEEFLKPSGLYKERACQLEQGQNLS